jgi:HAE1 family hydrophobic/amphiphilic exporter-1
LRDGFLYQFGITAAAAVMVSLLVSFTLTPMMCARMLHVSAKSGSHEAAGSVRVSIDGLTRVHGNLRFSMKHRAAVALFGVAVIALSIPMYRLIRQDYLPTNVDDGQFEVRASAPEGVSLAAMDDVMKTVNAS